MPRYTPLKKDAFEEINAEFYSNYNLHHWYYKIKILEMLQESSTKFHKKIENPNYMDIDKKRFDYFISSEVLVTFFHISEALFNLIISDDHALPWFGMKKVLFDDTVKFASDIQNDGISEKEVGEIFYLGISPPQEIEDEFEDSLYFIKNYLPAMARQYSDNNVYLEYKHGLRFYTTESGFVLGPNMGGPRGEKPILSEEGIAQVYLEKELLEKDGSEEWWQIKRVTKGFDPDFSLKAAEKNLELIWQFINIRCARNNDQANNTEIMIFDPSELENLGPDPDREWKMETKLPAGDFVIALDLAE